MINKRPHFLNLWQIRLPLTGVVSILHRISGVTIFLLLPFLLYLLELSLGSAEGFVRANMLVSHWSVRAMGLLLLWLFALHLFAGIRILLIDMEWVSGLAAARRSAVVVLLAAITVTLVGVLL